MATAVTSPAAPAAPTGERTKPIPENKKGALGKEAFLQMLVAQLRNQDPLSPADGKEMAAQLAQFSSVEQMVTANDTLAQIRDALKLQGAAAAPGSSKGSASA